MIKNMTAALPELGKIKSGVKGKEITSKEGNKFRPPQKLDHFIITTMERSEDGDLVADTKLMEALKKSDKARTDKDGNLTGIPIKLLYNDIDLNFPTRYACYVGGRCTCSGDGETAETRDGRTVACPCEKQDMSYQGKDKCKINGKLYCVIDGTTSVGACHVLRTTSFNTVQSILGGLSFIQAAAGGMLAFLPLQLVLTPKTTVIPSSGAPTTVYIASIVYNGSIDELRQAALGMAQNRAKYMIEMDQVESSAKQLAMSVVESEEEQKEIQDEFYPDAVDLPVDAQSGSEVESKEKPVEEKPVEEKKEPEVKPDPEPGAEKPKEITGISEPVPITDEQKRLIVKLKKQLKVTDKAEWEAWVKEAVPGVTSAVDMTQQEADVFIELLKKKGDVPF